MGGGDGMGEASKKTEYEVTGVVVFVEKFSMQF